MGEMTTERIGWTDSASSLAAIVAESSRTGRPPIDVCMGIARRHYEGIEPASHTTLRVAEFVIRKSKELGVDSALIVHGLTRELLGRLGAQVTVDALARSVTERIEEKTGRHYGLPSESSPAMSDAAMTTDSSSHW